MVVEGGQDVVALPDTDGAGVGPAEFERAARPGPEVEVRVCVGRLELWDGDGGGEEAIRGKVGGNGGAYGAFLGVCRKGCQSFGGGGGGEEDCRVGVNVSLGWWRFDLLHNQDQRTW